MPRLARLDAPGTLHHVMARGIERRMIFREDSDRDDFLRRVAALVREEAWTVYAWALMPNHFHLLMRTGRLPLSRTMRRLMTGYAVSFNRRHTRWGHLFQNRFKSIVVDEEGYFLELVRYLHLNPLRAKQVKTLEDLDRYPYSGHSALMGRVDREWQDTETVLQRYARRVGPARRRYREDVKAAIPLGRRKELQGGGFLRSAGGWEAVKALRRGREAFTSDERILGAGRFVERMLKEAQTSQEERERMRRSRVTLPVLVHRICRDLDVAEESVWAGGRGRDASRVRSVVAHVWMEHLGRSGRQLARALGVHPVSLWQAAQRAGLKKQPWQEKVKTWCTP